MEKLKSYTCFEELKQQEITGDAKVDAKSLEIAFASLRSKRVGKIKGNSQTLNGK